VVVAHNGEGGVVPTLSQAFDGDSLASNLSRAERGDRWGGLFPLHLR
jgi:hypothetical protein